MSSSIMQAFKKLNVSPASEDHEEIFEVSYQYLSNVKNFDDVKSFNNCLVALINLDKYQKALQLIKNIKNEDIITQFSIEVGYVYYKTRQSDSLQQLYKTVVANETSSFLVRGLKHIIAQDYYQRGENKKALEIYHELISNNDDIDSSSDLYTNELAIISQLNFLNNQYIEPTSKVNEENHDLVFNNALIALSNNELQGSLAQLDNALQLLNSLNLDDESYQLEKCPILLAKAYIYQLQDKKEAAKEVLDSLKLAKFNDLLINLILNNNYYGSNQLVQDETSVNLVQRSLNIQSNLSQISGKLTSNQYNVLVKNNLLLKYLTGSLSSNSNYLSSANLSQFIGQGDYSLLSYKVLTKLGISNDDLINNQTVVARKLFKIINNCEITTDNFSELSVISLIIFSLNSKTGHYNQALSSLEKLVQFNLSSGDLVPGLIGSLFNLYEILDSSDKFISLIDELISKLSGKDTLSYEQYNFFKALGFKLLILNDEKYLVVFRKLNTINPDDILIHNVLNKTNTNLSSVETLISNIDDDVINTDIESLVTSVKTKKSIVGNKVDKKRPRKPKFSAGKVLKPASQLDIDQERWLPMKLRSYYKPKKSKKKSTHQGAVESPATTQPSTPSSTPAPTTPATSTKKNKKKKKGKK